MNSRIIEVITEYEDTIQNLVKANHALVEENEQLKAILKEDVNNTSSFLVERR